MFEGDILDFKEWIENKKKNQIKAEYITTCDIVDFLDAVKALIFPGYVNLCDDLSCYLDNATKEVIAKLDRLLTQIKKITDSKFENTHIITNFLSQIPNIDYLINTDIDALFDGDPAAKSKTEIIICYPGFTAIFTYRIAHVFYELGIEILPRALSEYAHSLTGIDIHPGAKIDEYFFIDHGTGIVIGETCEIGKHVKIYQGVTLGALSLKAGHKLIGTKRHPTIMDNVTIYSGASIFGGNTIIGKNTTIGSSAYITSSVEDNMTVTIKGQTKKKQVE